MTKVLLATSALESSMFQSPMFLFTASVYGISLLVVRAEWDLLLPTALCEAAGHNSSDAEVGGLYELGKSGLDSWNSWLEDDMSSTFGPTLRVGIVSFGSRNIVKYMAYALAINLAYARHNRYYFRFLDETSFSDHADIDDVRWSKVRILEQALDPVDGWAKHMDYVVWVDADLVFTDLALRLELAAATLNKPGSHVVASAEHAGSSTLINSGCVIVRNTRWAREFLRDWWRHADRSLYSDQEQFDLLYEQRRKAAMPNERAFADHVAILAPDAINSDPPAMTQQKATSQVLHLMGEEEDYRVRVFRAGLQELCRYQESLQGGEPHMAALLAPQLTLTQPNLLRWAREVYRGESEALLAQYEARLPAPLSSSSPSAWLGEAQSLEASRRLANAAHHFAHALVHPLPEDAGSQPGAGAGGRYRQAITLRKKVYQLLRRNLVAWKRRRGDSSSDSGGGGRVGIGGTGEVSPAALRADWPELLKVTSIAGQHLLSVTADDVVSQREKRQVAGEILTMMQEMLQNSHEGQHDAILLMVADIHQQIGVLDLALSYLYMEHAGGDAERSRFVQAALQHFELALEVTSSVAEKAGQHLLVAPLILTANARASLQEFDPAFVQYEQALQLNARHLGGQHSSNVPLLIDFAISLLHGGDCERAASVLARAEGLLHTCAIPPESVEYRRTLEYKDKLAVKCGF